MIGYQGRTGRDFFKSLLHSYLIVFILSIFSSILLTIISGSNLNTMLFLLQVVLYFYWMALILAFVMSIALYFIGKIRSRRYFRIGYGMTILVFGTIFCIGHYWITKAIAEAIYIGIMMSQ